VLWGSGDCGSVGELKRGRWRRSNGWPELALAVPVSEPAYSFFLLLKTVAVRMTRRATSDSE
jgi:hypothetical protein